MDRTEAEVLAQVVRRATRASLASEMTILGTGCALGGLSTIIRSNGGISVVRPCFKEEVQVLFAGDGVVEQKSGSPSVDVEVKGVWAWTVASCAALQVASCAHGETREAVPIIRRSSDLSLETSLAQVASKYIQETLETGEGDVGVERSSWTLETAMTEILSTLKPSPLLLRFLSAIQEYGTLAEAAVKLEETIPASAKYALGLAELAELNRTFTKLQTDRESKDAADLEATRILNIFLAGAAALEAKHYADVDTDTVAKLIHAAQFGGETFLLPTSDCLKLKHVRAWKRFREIREVARGTEICQSVVETRRYLRV